MVSPRPSCISGPVSVIDSPPSWRMPTSNDTRVRVDGLSKIMAMVLPASGFAAARAPPFMARLVSMIPRSSAGGTSIRSRKWRMPFAAHPAAPCLRAPCCARSTATQARSSRADGLGHLGLGDDQRRHQPHDVVAGQRPKAASRRGRRRPARRSEPRHFSPISRPSPRTSAITGGMPVLDLGEPLPEQQRHPADVVEEARLGHHVEHGVAGRHRQRIAAEGRAVGAGRHALGGLGGGQHRADREARAEPLGEPHHVGRHAELLIAEHLAEPADAGLHLVEGRAAGRARRRSGAAP